MVPGPPLVQICQAVLPSPPSAQVADCDWPPEAGIIASQSSSTALPVVLVFVTVDEPPAPLVAVVLPAPPAPDTLLLVEFAPNPPGPMLPVVALPVVELVTPWLVPVEAVVAVELVDVVAVLPMVAEPAVVVPVVPGPPIPPVTLVWLVVSSIPGGPSPAGSEHPALSRIQGSAPILGKGARRPS